MKSDITLTQWVKHKWWRFGRKKFYMITMTYNKKWDEVNTYIDGKNVSVRMEDL